MQDRMSRTIMEKYGYDTHYQEENARITESWDKAQSSVSICFLEAGLCRAVGSTSD